MLLGPRDGSAAEAWRLDNSTDAPITVDTVSVAADLGSPAGYAYQTGKSVISNHLEAETRFHTPQLLADHGVRRAVNVLIEKGGEGKAFFGVLEVDSSDPGQFDQADADFLYGFAGLLGIAIERQQAADAAVESDRRRDEFLAWAERGERLNAGVVLFARTLDFDPDKIDVNVNHN